MRDARDARVAIGEVDPVDQHEPDDFAEGQRHDREIVAAQPQHRKAEDDAPHRGEQAGERQADPERQAVGGREQRIGIGADGIKSDIAEIEQAREPDHDVQPPAQHHVDHDLDAVVVDPFQRAGRPEQPQHDERKQDRRNRARTARTTWRRRRGRATAARPPPRLGRGFGERAAHSARSHGPDPVEPDAPVGRRNLAQQDEQEHDCGDRRTKAASGRSGSARC